MPNTLSVRISAHPACELATLADVKLQALRAQVMRHIDRLDPAQTERNTKTDGKTGRTVNPTPGMFLIRHDEPTAFEASIYQPLVCLILQGAKETSVGDSTVSLAKGESVVVSHRLPVRARITRASRSHPYLALVILLDLAVLRALYADIGDAGLEFEPGPPLKAMPVDARVFEVIARYLVLLEDPIDTRVLGPVVLKELHYRLLMSDSGGMLRALLHSNSHASRISKALDTLRDDFKVPLDIARLARSVGMSTSSFHKHFKSVTRTTPLQYQKDLRLTEARRLLQGGRHSVASTAYEVGYESPSQFSREYTRKFGASPRTDVVRA